MPYIPQYNREYYEPHGPKPENAGELNFVLTSEVLKFLGDNPRYEDYNAAIGALECCKLELYRRAIAPYEQKKIEENGDVYP